MVGEASTGPAYTVVPQMPHYGAGVHSAHGRPAAWGVARGAWITLNIHSCRLSMRVLNIVTQMEAGGAQGAAVRISESLRARGHEAETWFLYRKRPAFIESDYLRVLSPVRPRDPVSLLRLGWRLYRELRRHRPDAVIAHTHYGNALVLPIAWLARVPRRIATQHAIESSSPLPARLVNRWLGMSPCVYRNIVVSRTVRNSFSGYPAAYRRKLVTILNGIDAHPSNLSRDAARVRFGLPVDRPIVLTVGRLARVKNHDVLIRALMHLPDWHLVIAGDGERKHTLMAAVRELGVSDRATFLGEVPSDAVWALHRAADVFAMPSHHEAFGLAAIEAAASGLPLVCSDIPAMRELFSPGAAIFCPADDDMAFADALACLHADPTLAATYGMAARRVSESHTIDKMTDGYERLLQ